MIMRMRGYFVNVREAKLLSGFECSGCGSEASS